MEPTVEEILKHTEFDPSIVQRVANRKVKVPIAIVPPNPSWPAHFAHIKSIITTALPPSTALCISHVGSTSVPNLPAKAVIDIDLTISNPVAEENYVPALERAGFQFLFREPEWCQHRFFVMNEPYHCNLHVFRPGAAELVRHLIMRDWLISCEADRELYASVKMGAAEISARLGETQVEYNSRKQQVIRQILERAFRAKGYLATKIEG
ncbi:related to GrpB domain protein [Ramularia collo-cygni]|uniref:Related to GrpB domain protein n=1 Tax=Ramularia collo-cygni TaxID=112498 RepID=A0A2D3UZI8_9PEZI|nr:related to GrpB domain protein [Ramularia collo-cygni]CZT15614.1 related to GrpB domain protein [Ramularia collo-cygni]